MKVDLEIGKEVTKAARKTLDCKGPLFLLITLSCLGSSSSSTINNLLLGKYKLARECYWTTARVIRLFLAADVDRKISGGFIENSPLCIDENDEFGPTPWMLTRDSLLEKSFHIQAYRMPVAVNGGSNGRVRASIVFWRAPDGEAPECQILKSPPCA